MRDSIIAVLATLLLASHVMAPQGGSAVSNRRPVVRGTFTDESLGKGVFSGTVRVDRFVDSRMDVVAIGRLLGVLAASNGEILGTTDQEVTVRVSGISATCQLLRLELGPADVPIGEVQLHLDKAALGITTRDGTTTGGFGERLCAAAEVVSRGAHPAEVAAALNEVLAGIDSPR